MVIKELTLIELLACCSSAHCIAVLCTC